MLQRAGDDDFYLFSLLCATTRVVLVTLLFLEQSILALLSFAVTATTMSVASKTVMIHALFLNCLEQIGTFLPWKYGHDCMQDVIY